MDDRLMAIADVNHGLILHEDATRLGLDDNDLRRWIRSGKLVRLKRGLYLREGDVLGRDAMPEDRYRLQVRTALRALNRVEETWRASHHAQLALLGVALWGVDLRTVDVCGPTAKTRRRQGARLHPVDPWAGDLLPGSLLQTLFASGVVPATVAGDDALHRELVTRPALTATIDQLPAAATRARALRWLEGLDEKSESVGETRARLLLKALGYSVRTQVPIRSGAFRARADLLIDDWLILEFDGLLKYQGEGGRDALVREKTREETLHRMGFRVVRLLWRDLDSPGHVRELVERGLALVRETRRAG